MKKYTIVALTDNHPGVLHRIAIVFTRRKINIQSLTVSETDKDNVSRFTILVEIEPNKIETIVKQLNRIIEVQLAYACTDEEILYKEVLLLKLENSKNNSQKIKEISQQRKAEILLEEDEYLVVEITGEQDYLSSVYNQLKEFGVIAYVRSGRVAVKR